MYDLAEDPYEMNNLIEDSSAAVVRDRPQDWILDEMDRIRDTFRSWRWGSRPWRQARTPSYGAPDDRGRPRPEGFPLQPPSMEAGG